MKVRYSVGCDTSNIKLYITYKYPREYSLLQKQEVTVRLYCLPTKTNFRNRS